MADSSSSTIVEVSLKHALPTEFSIMEEARSKGTQQQWAHHTANELVSPNNFHKIVAEIVGTYILIFAGCGGILVGKGEPGTIIGIAMVWGLVCMAVIYALGHVSGAHLNPAVTIAFAAGCNFPWKQVPMYVASQLLGSTLACLTLRVLFNDKNNIEPAVTRYSSATTDLEAIIWEFIITFILMFIICGVASDRRAIKELSGVAVGATILFNVIIAGPITGASMNPARSIAPAIVSGVYKNLWVYIVAPVLGAMAAAMIYRLLRISKPDKPKETTKNIYNDLYLHPDPSRSVETFV